jgi:hypothetical protein
MSIIASPIEVARISRFSTVISPICADNFASQRVRTLTEQLACRADIPRFFSKFELNDEIEIWQGARSTAIQGLLCARRNRLIAVNLFSARLQRLMVVNICVIRQLIAIKAIAAAAFSSRIPRALSTSFNEDK